jgi:signal transduction histidine kinase
MLSTRTQLQVSVGAALLGILLVAAFAWQALERASQQATSVLDQLRRIKVVARIEEQLHDLDGLPGVEPDDAIDKLERRLKALEELPWRGEHVTAWVEEIGVEIRSQIGAHPSARSWSQSERVASQIEKAAISLTLDASETGGEERHQSALALALLAAGVTLAFVVLASLTYLRLRREREDALARVRRNDRLAALGTIAASMAHELNNPLATIAGCSAAIGDRLKRHPDDHDDELEYVGMIADETRRCTGLVDSLRDLARDTPLAISGAELGNLAREIVQLVELNRSEKDVRVTVEAAEPVDLVCDPDKIKQLLLNLVLNSRDACEDGGRIRVTVGGGEDGDARLMVEDDGAGIARKDLGRVFEAFHTGKTRGLGIGLFLCQRIVHLHGGAIRVESDGPGKGARFTIRLPTRPTT